MKLTKEQENKLTEMCFAEKSNKEIAQEMGIELSDVHAARSRLGITIPKVKAMIGEFEKEVEEVPRTKEDIQAEIDKVQRAWETALKKSARCMDRIEQLKKELEAVK